jgi:hypothetical protein
MTHRRSRRRTRKLRHILLVWLTTLGICAVVWIVGYDVIGEEIYHTDVNWILIGIILTVLAILGGVALTVGIFENRNRL